MNILTINDAVKLIQENQPKVVVTMDEIHESDLNEERLSFWIDAYLEIQHPAGGSIYSAFYADLELNKSGELSASINDDNLCFYVSDLKIIDEHGDVIDPEYDDENAVSEALKAHHKFGDQDWEKAISEQITAAFKAQLEGELFIERLQGHQNYKAA